MTNLLPRLEFLLQAVVRRRSTCPRCGVESPIATRKNLVVRIRRCEECRFYFTDPIYERSVFGSLYDRLYGAEGSTTAVPESSRLSELMQVSFRGTDKDCHERLELLQKMAGGPRLLELGSSWGYFLHQAQEHGFEPTGVELSGPRRRFGRKSLGQTIVESLDDLGDEQFDVVYSAHTLEHFTDLRGVFERLRSLLVPGGVLAVEVPNFDLALGASVLPTIGAVHPLGFPSEFFTASLPTLGFDGVSVFERWSDVPGAPVERSESDVVIALAVAVEETLP